LSYSLHCLIWTASSYIMYHAFNIITVHSSMPTIQNTFYLWIILMNLMIAYHTIVKIKDYICICHVYERKDHTKNYLVLNPYRIYRKYRSCWKPPESFTSTTIFYPELYKLEYIKIIYFNYIHRNAFSLIPLLFYFEI